LHLGVAWETTPVAAAAASGLGCCRQVSLQVMQGYLEIQVAPQRLGATAVTMLSHVLLLPQQQGHLEMLCQQLPQLQEW
jgi:hypothetical protein